MEERAVSGVMAPAFYELHRQHKEGAAVHYWLAGGRGSGPVAVPAAILPVPEGAEKI